MSEQDAAFDEELAEELEQLEYYSFGDYVEVLVKEVRRLKNDQVRVTFDPPAGDSFYKEMDAPVDPNHRTAFTELLETAGYRYSNASGLVGERIPAKYTDDGWEIIHQPQFDSRIEKLRFKLPSVTADGRLFWLSLCASGGLIFWPLTGIPLLYYFGVMDDDETMEWGDALVTYAFGLMFWMMLAVFMLAVFMLLPISEMFGA